MNIDIDLLEKLTSEDIEVIDDLKEILNKSKEYVNAIRKFYKFEIGETKKTIHKDCHNAEYLTIEGEWQARYLYQSYDVMCTVKDVFEVLKHRYLSQRGLIEKNDNLAEAGGYFYTFATKTVKCLNEEEVR